ncbi:MAG: hypothetical protein JWL60_1824 [Gemmatimonadetes bacterium]|nr:hypothetical protein [Gemmatimonadota bacterium]
MRAAATLSPARPAYAAGIRAAIATVGPMALALLTGHGGGSTWLSIGGFNAALSDRGGAYRDRAGTMSAVVGTSATAVLLGSLAGRHVWVAVPLTFAVAFVASLARVWGASGVAIGGGALSAFVIALAFPAADPSSALLHAALAVAGGVWAMFLALFLWPLRPYRPSRLAIAACYRAVASLLDDIVLALVRQPAEPRHEAPLGSATVRAALEESRHVLAQLRRGRPGSSGRGEQLVVLNDLCDQLFGHAVAVTEAVDAIPAGERDPAAQLVVLESLSMIATTARSLAEAVLVEDASPPVALGWNGDALRAAVQAREHTPPAADSAALHYLHAAAILDRAARFAESAAASARTLGAARGSTIEFPLPDDAALELDRPSLLATVRAILTPDSVILLYALRVAVTTSVAVLLSYLLELERGYWITITVIVIMQPYTGATTQRALQRVAGTVLGGMLTALLGAYFHDPRAVLVLSFIFAATCVALMPVNYAAFSIFLTPTFVLLAEATAGDWHLAATRVLNTLLGGALALGAARLLWPSPERNRLPGYIVAALRANAEYLRCVGERFGDRGDAASEAMRSARRHAGLAIANAEESFQRLLGEHSGPAEALAPAISYITYTRRLTAATASLALARHAAPPRAAEVVRPFTAAAGDALDALAQAMADERLPEPLPGLATLDGAAASLPPLLRARVERLGGQLRMVEESIRRQLEHAPAQ